MENFDNGSAALARAQRAERLRIARQPRLPHPRRRGMGRRSRYNDQLEN
ncbi:MAG TPA: hypothetical protein VIR30_15340 [Nocardioides sp.]